MVRRSSLSHHALQRLHRAAVPAACICVFHQKKRGQEGQQKGGQQQHGAAQQQQQWQERDCIESGL
eukprot:scaffold291039_cov14-Tisochrysis_lutea.AAC.1